MKISIVTPWAGDTANLIDGYAAAVADADEVICIDNASSEATQTALAALQQSRPGVVIVRNEQNAGFAGANNQGYALATGDIIIFLNSDVEPAGDWCALARADVRNGGLYGPALGQQLVYGMWLPYLEGWCIGATKTTWERLQLRSVEQEMDAAYEAVPIDLYTPDHGPWDAEAYLGPYWEDNDLCLRAAQAEIDITLTRWPVKHLGGRTAGAIVKHGETFERNRATFASRVKAVWEDIRKRGD